MKPFCAFLTAVGLMAARTVPVVSAFDLTGTWKGNQVRAF